MTIQEKIRRERKCIRDRNRRFRSMSKPAQRVIIAKDVLQVLDKNIGSAKSGVYVILSNKAYTRSITDNDTTLLENDKCNVCALGAMFVSLARRDPNIKINSASYGRYTLETALGKYFSQHQLDTIEANFENTLNEGYNTAITKIKDSTLRMKAIMNNIIDNKGTFKS